jgi:hypothetical protein
MPVQNESDFIVQIGGPFNQLAVTEKSGGEVSKEISKYPDPLKDKSYFTSGRRMISDLVLRLPYDASVHEPLIKELEKDCLNPFSIVVQAVRNCPDVENYGPPVIYKGCVLSKIKRPDVKRGGGGSTAMIEFEFAVGDL